MPGGHVRPMPVRGAAPISPAIAGGAETKMTPGDPFCRRSFIAGVSAVGGCLALALAIPFAPARADPAELPPQAGERKSMGPRAPAGETKEVTAWLVIHEDDSVVVRIARAEMGQGALTGLAMLVAEELGCDWTKVRTEFVSPAANLRRHGVWGDMSTGASRSIAASQLYLRRAGATARQMLIAAAALRLNVPASECSAHNGVITHTASGRS